METTGGDVIDVSLFIEDNLSLTRWRRGEESFTINVQFFFSEKPQVYLLKRYNGCTTRIETE